MKAEKQRDLTSHGGSIVLPWRIQGCPEREIEGKDHIWTRIPQ